MNTIRRLFRLVVPLALVCLAVPFATAAQAANCTLVQDFHTGAQLYAQGDTAARFSPCSTFKVPLALMGFDSGILRTPEEPEWPYPEGAVVNTPFDQQLTNATSWLRYSVVWFSQELTAKMGPELFQKYTTMFNYGNMDVSGDPGLNNGLTRSWLSSSLQISPQEQLVFLGRMLRREFPLSAHAYDSAFASVPTFQAGDWTVHGKTGGGWIKGETLQNRDLKQGWFVGWAERPTPDGPRTVLFVRLVLDEEKRDDPASIRARNSLLQELPRMLEGK
ncbi:class D beta-lactamase [Megalodesulfovibrio paquesii]